jgi:DNA-binding transcriptional ArsR family regulator
LPAPVDITDPFRALSDPTRREIVRLLAAGPLPVRVIAGRFPAISRPAVSKHLRNLREGGLVTEERSGRERYYSLDLGVVETALGWMETVRREALAGKSGRRDTGFKAVQKEPTRPKPPAAARATQEPKTVAETDDWQAW